MSPRAEVPLRTLTVDIGGIGIKRQVLDVDARPLGERRREPTPQPAHPAAVLATLSKLLKDAESFDRVSIGFPGVVKRGVVFTAPNLDRPSWPGVKLAERVGELTGKPTRAMNDADLQGFGVIEGRGVEMVLTLGTGLGSALFIDGALVPNLELAHHPFGDGRTYEERISDAELKRIGAAEWTDRVEASLSQIRPIWNFDRLHIGGGNLRHYERELPEGVRAFDLAEGLRGGVQMWEELR